MELTDREFWKNYWLKKPWLFSEPIDRRSLFKPLIERVIKDRDIKNAIEVGGFPGTFSALLKLEYGIKADLVDYFVDEELFSQFLIANGLKEGDIQATELDVFTDFKTETKYDLVYSIGLIEHFEDTPRILEGHKRFLSEEGLLLIIIPNFTGLNGWFQRNFDRENYDKHFITCMSPAYLRDAHKNFKYVESDYFGGFTIWLENYDKQGLAVKIFFKATWYFGKLLSKILGLKNRFFSPYIYVLASNEELNTSNSGDQ